MTERYWRNRVLRLADLQRRLDAKIKRETRVAVPVRLALLARVPRLVLPDSALATVDASFKVECLLYVARAHLRACETERMLGGAA